MPRFLHIIRVALVATALLTSGAGVSSAQNKQSEIDQSRSHSGEQYIEGQTRFIRQLDAVSWNLNIAAGYTSNKIDLSVYNRMGTRLFLFNGEAQNIQDEYDAGMSLSYQLIPGAGFTSTAGTYTFTNTNLRQDVFLAGIFIQPYEQLRFSALGGILRDQRSDRDDQGFSWQVGLHTPTLRFGDFQFEPAAIADIAYINPRKLQTVRYGTTLRYRDENNMLLTSEIWLGNARRDSYQSSSLLNRTEANFIEAIESDSAMVSIFLQTPVTSTTFADFSIDGLSNVRRILNNPLEETGNIALYDSRSERQFLNMGIALRRPTPGLQLQGGVRWAFQVRESRLINTTGLPVDQVRRRADILENSNFSQRRFELFTQNTANFTQRYSASLAGNISILRYNTPEINKDDRDELAILLRTTHRYQITEALQGSVTLAGEAFHFVYLFSERSIENNWRRSIRLIPEITWQPSPTFYMNNRFTVRANYTVEDFELPNRPKNDQSAREFIAANTTSWTFAPGWNVQAEFSRSELRIGKLFWETFQETPIDTIITWDVRTMVSRQYGDIVISSGVRYFHKFDFLQQASLAVDVEENGTITRVNRISTGNRTTTQWGPSVMIRLPMSARNELFINGWYQMQATRQKLYTEYPEVYRSAFLRAERRADRRSFPNIEISVRFRF
ncbi:MAG: hypothetical protein LAT52_06705 [Balneolales bacterium]|nr:hypothetical protein [Balneolales bacterium]